MRLILSCFTILTLLSGNAFATSSEREPSIVSGIAQFLYREVKRELKRRADKKNQDPNTKVKSNGFDLNATVERRTHVRITSCTVQTNEDKAFVSKDLGECLTQNYIEQYFKENDRAITVNYTHEGLPSYLNLYWKPYYDGAKMEFNKFKADFQQLKVEKQICAAKQKYSVVKDQTLGRTKYERAQKIAASTATMHSTLGRIKVVLEHPGDLQNIFETSDLLSLFINFDKISEFDFDIVMDPDDFGNILSKVNFFETSLQVPSLETYLQFKISLKCKDFHLNVDPDEN